MMGDHYTGEMVEKLFLATLMDLNQTTLPNCDFTFKEQ